MRLPFGERGRRICRQLPCPLVLCWNEVILWAEQKLLPGQLPLFRDGVMGKFLSSGPLPNMSTGLSDAVGALWRSLVGTTPVPVIPKCALGYGSKLKHQDFSPGFLGFQNLDTHF